MFNQSWIRKISVNLAIPERNVTEVINWQFSSTAKAITKHSSVELSGIGVFRLTKVTANKAITGYTNGIKRKSVILEDINISPARKTAIERQIRILENCIISLKERMHEN